MGLTQDRLLGKSGCRITEILSTCPITCWHCAGSAGVKLQVYGKLYGLHGWAVGKHWQDAQKGRTSHLPHPGAPRRAVPQARLAAVFHTISNGWPGRPSLARAERAPFECARSASWRTTRPPVPSFFSILLEAEDIEDDDAHKDTVIGKRPECMAFHKRKKGRDHNPSNDE